MSVLASRRSYLPDNAFRLVLRDANNEAPDTTSIVHSPPGGARRVPDWIEAGGVGKYILEIQVDEIELDGGNEYTVSLVSTSNKWLGDDLNGLGAFPIPNSGRYYFDLEPSLIEIITHKPYVAIQSNIMWGGSNAVLPLFNYTAAIMRVFG